MNEREKKRLYNRRILEVEHASFTPLIFTIHGAMGIESGELLAVKRDLPKSTVTSWVRTLSMLMCLRGSRSIKSSTIAINDIDVQGLLTKNQREH